MSNSESVRLPQLHLEDAPLRIRLAESLGIANFLIQKFVFCKKRKRYQIKGAYGKNQIVSNQLIEIPPDYEWSVEILTTQSHSIPMCRITPKKAEDYVTIVYSHGNNEDLIDALGFASRLSKSIKAEFIVYDYSGYGDSKINSTTESSICEDLEIILSWVSQYRQLEDIVLWGFSLGSYPTTVCSSHYNVLGVILQAPFSSLLNILNNPEEQLKHYRNDHFSNMSIIHKINSKIFILHSNKDTIIPFSHSKRLVEEYQMNCLKHNLNKIRLLEVNSLSHNGMHPYLSSEETNPLKKSLQNYIKELERDQKLKKRIKCVSEDSPKLKEIYDLISLKKVSQKSAESFFSFCVCDEVNRKQQDEIYLDYSLPKVIKSAGPVQNVKTSRLETDQ